jgi:4-amino-4-deoxy-L-arabinose transferase-like glycosyltransferase
MSTAARLRSDVRFGFGLVMVTALVLAFFICKTFVDPGPRQYALDFGNARWIEPPHEGAAGYFRDTLYISKPVVRGWIEVAATDHFILYVNGTEVNETYFGAERVTGIFDIRPWLIQGKNVIAIYVPRVFAPGSSQLRVRGAYATVGAKEIPFVSDETWRASNTPDGIVESYQWDDPMLDDTTWALARPVDVHERFSTVQAVQVPPRLFASDTPAQWICGPDATARNVSLAGRFDLPLNRGDTWLQVAATGAYDLLINGHYVIWQPAPARTIMPFSLATVAGPAAVTTMQLQGLAQQNGAAVDAQLPLQVPTTVSVPTLLAYDISRWVHAGSNEIVARVRADNTPALLLADVSTEMGGGGELRAVTDRTWHALPGGEAARELGANGAAPWGWLPIAPAQIPQTPAADLVKYGPWAVAFAVTAVAMLFLWLLSARLLGGAEGMGRSQALALDAILHVPMLAGLLICWLLTFDIRLNMDWCYTPLVLAAAVMMLIVCRVAALLAAAFTPVGPVRSRAARPAHVYWKIAAFAVVVLGGFCLRAWDLNGMSLGSDEVTMIMNAKGVLHSGYPHSMRGSYDRLLATYELIPYSLAASSMFFGNTEFAYHFPALVFSTLTIALIGLVGWRMFDWRVGWVASFIYAFFPPGIAWARNGFYPSQEQFLSLVTFWTFYEAVRAAPLKKRFLTFAAVGFILSYLSWEGSGFIVPALFVAILAIRWKDFSWMGEWHFWRCFFVMTVVVLSQLSFRQLTLDDYLGVGYSLSDITAPTVVYTDLLVYNPWYYIRVLFFPEVNFVLSLFLFLGFLFCWRNKAIRYLVVTLFSLEFFYSNFLPFYAPRYCYNAETLVILCGVGIFFAMRDRVASLGGEWAPWWQRAMGWTGAAALTAWLLLATNEFAVESYRLSPDAENPALFARVGYYKTDHRGAARFVEQQREPGDAVVAFMPHMYEFYTNHTPEYSINTFLNEKMMYDGGHVSPQFIDKFRGCPLIRSLEELKDVQSRYRRLWILVPIRDDNVALSPDVLTYLTREGRVAYESYREQVVELDGANRLSDR